MGEAHIVCVVNTMGINYKRSYDTYLPRIFSSGFHVSSWCGTEARKMSRAQ